MATAGASSHEFGACERGALAGPGGPGARAARQARVRRPRGRARSDRNTASHAGSRRISLRAVLRRSKPISVSSVCGQSIGPLAMCPSPSSVVVDPCSP